jgi:hypothetical protein
VAQAGRCSAIAASTLPVPRRLPLLALMRTGVDEPRLN